MTLSNGSLIMKQMLTLHCSGQRI